MKPAAHGLSDVGKVRKNNEDSHLIDEALGLYIVCDGVGGHAAGNVASATAVKAIHDQINRNRSMVENYVKAPAHSARSELAHLLQQAIEVANTTVHAIGEADPTKRGLSTTAVVALFAGDHLVVGHVGDSRVYLHRKGKIHKLTEDHKVSAEMKRQGVWTDQDAAQSPYANVLTRAVGIQKFVQVDVLQIEIAAGDRILLCSDGLSDYFPQSDELGALFEKNPNDKIVPILVNMAKDRGGKDNITAVCVQFNASATDAKTNVANKPAADPVSGEATAHIDALKKSDVLGKVPLFRFFDYPELLKVLNLMKTITYKKGEMLFSEGSISQEMFVLVSGEVAVRKGNQVIAKLGKGEVFGEMGIFDNAPRSASVAAAETTVALTCTRRDLLALLRRETQLTVKLLWALNQEMNRRLRDTTQELAKLRAELRDEDDTAIDLPFQVPSSGD